jgi:hypothetical protein
MRGRFNWKKILMKKSFPLSGYYFLARAKSKTEESAIS